MHKSQTLVDSEKVLLIVQKSLEQLEIWIRSNKTEDTESVPQSFTLETKKRVVCLYAVTYLTQPKNFSV